MSPASMAGLIRGISTTCGFMRPVPARRASNPQLQYAAVPGDVPNCCNDVVAFDEPKVLAWDQQQQIFAVTDLNVSPKWEFNIGVGVGSTAPTDHLIVKAILGRRFDWESLPSTRQSITAFACRRTSPGANRGAYV